MAGEVLLLTTAEFTSADTAARAAALEKRGARIEAMIAATSDRSAQVRRVDLKGVLSRLAELEVNELLIEAGPTLSGEFVRQGLADELLIYMAPALLGPQARPLYEIPALGDLAGAQRFELVEAMALRTDLRLRLRPAGSA